MKRIKSGHIKHYRIPNILPVGLVNYSEVPCFCMFFNLIASTVFSSVPLSCGASSIPGVYNSCMVHPLARCLCGSLYLPEKHPTYTMA